jgi:hypothetical protein
MNYQESMLQLAQSVNNYFDEVYFDAEIVINDKNMRFPAISKADEWINLTPTDQHETVYIRRNGADDVLRELKLGSCAKSYVMRTPVRIVYFKDHVQDQDKILTDLMNAALVGKIELRSIIRDKWKLLKDESSGDYNFGATTAYFAIDTYLIWELVPNACEYECSDIINPLKKQPCLVVA